MASGTWVLHPPSALRLEKPRKQSFPRGRAPSSRRARRQAPKHAAHSRKRCLSDFSPAPRGVHSRRALGGGGRALWAPGLLVRERAVISPRRACWEVLLFERGSEPGLQRRDVPCLAPAFPPAPLREVQRRTMKGDATPPKPQAPSPTIIRFSQHAPLLTGHARRLPAAPGAFLCSTASRPSSQ